MTILGFAAVGAVASPVLQARGDPIISDAPGFSIRVELATARDLPTPVAGTYLRTIPADDDGHFFLTSSAAAAHELVFFNNGTDPKHYATYWAVEGAQSAGWDLTPEPPGFAERADLGIGRKGKDGIHVTAHNAAPPALVSEGHAWFFCPRGVNGQKANLLETKPRAELIGPDDCVEVKLVPVCEPIPLAAQDVVNLHYVQCFAYLHQRH